MGASIADALLVDRRGGARLGEDTCRFVRKVVRILLRSCSDPLAQLE
jgi:hypothetical protein